MISFFRPVGATAGMLKFILVDGVLRFGTLWTVLMIVWDIPEMWQDPRRIIYIVPTFIVLGFAAGALWAALMWPLLRLLHRLGARWSGNSNTVP
jgi:hypothetical protein